MVMLLFMIIMPHQKNSENCASLHVPQMECFAFLMILTRLNGSNCGLYKLMNCFYSYLRIKSVLKSQK